MNRERLKTGLDRMGIAADETALERFEAFHAILDEYNARMDLTAVLDEDERVDRHDLDSAAPPAHGRESGRADMLLCTWCWLGNAGVSASGTSWAPTWISPGLMEPST